MKIALIGYGKMGKTIESLLPARGHEAILATRTTLTRELLQQADVAIEFTNPDSVVNNLLLCFEAGTPVVCGSTGWLEQWTRIEDACTEKNGTLLYASNFSIGVNIFFALNQKLAQLMNPHPEYQVQLTEIHHTQKKDAPSGTAITLAEQIIARLDRKHTWVNQPTPEPTALEIVSERIDPAPGTHSIKYSSDIDDIEITHTAHNRNGFALGAIMAAEFIAGKKGIYTMQNVLHL